MNTKLENFVSERTEDQEIVERMRRENLVAVESGGCAPPIMVTSDKAARRVAELERAASNVIRKAQQKSKLTSSVFTSDLQRLEAALAPAKKVD